MDDIRYKEEIFRINGEDCALSCNFNVIADIESWAGDINLWLSMPPMAAARIALAALLNEYYSQSGEKHEILSPREAGLLIPTEQKALNAMVVKINRLVMEAVLPGSPAKDEE